MLSNFFSPLNLTNILIYLLLIVFFDMFGSFIKRNIDRNNETDSRVLNWLIGLGGFLFIWFILSLFIAYTKINIIISITVLTLVSFPNYIQKKEYKTLLVEIRKCLVPLLIILPFLPSVFVKASLPPYYGDEMAYHYIAPSALLTLDRIKYTGGLYADLPRNLNLFWEIIFSLTKTYSIARLFHFSIFVTSMLFAYRFISKNFGKLAGFLLVFIFFSIPQDIILTSTLGYIDVGAFSFLFIALISAVGYLIFENKTYLYLSLIFWGLNLGTKYTGITNFVSFLIVFAVIYFARIKTIREKILVKDLLIGATIFICFGGYWYIKNFILYGNPIFPFLFKCWGNHFEPCPQTSGFFGDWTVKVNFSNFGTILSQLLPRNKILMAGALVNVPFLFWLDRRKIKDILIFIYSTIFLEFIFLKYSSGFYARYQQHLQLYILLAIVLTLTYKYKDKTINLIRKIVLVFIIASSVFYYMFNLYYSLSRYFVKDYEIKYALNQINIYDWIHVNFPDMEGTIKWCDRKDTSLIKLARFDPDLIWFTHDGLSRVFMMNCIFENPGDFNENHIKEDFWITSINKCVKDKDIYRKYPYEQDYQYNFRKLNNKLICESNEILPNLYIYDHTKNK